MCELRVSHSNAMAGAFVRTKAQVIPLNPAPSLVIQAPDPALTLRRQMLVSSLFKYVAEIQEIEDGYAFKFRRSELLVRRIADYIVFEGQHSPQLMFVLVAEPNGGVLWLQIRGQKSEKQHIRTAYTTLQMRVSPPA